jgi:hypothetical protein
MERKTLDSFCEFSKYANLDIFIEIFGEKLGTHLWNKYIEDYERDMVWTYNGLDNDNRERLVKYLKEREV